MANNVITRLRGLLRNNPAATGMGVVQIGGSVYDAQSWGFTRIAHNVYQNPTGYRCVEMGAAAFGRPGWEVRKPGSEDPLESSPLLDLLNNPSPGVSGTAMQKAIYRDRALTGKSFWLKMQGKDGFGDNGPTTGLRRLAPQRTTVLGNEDDDLIGFVYTDRNGQRMPILPESVVYVHRPHPERAYDGLAPALLAGLPAETDTGAARFNYDLMANDGALPGIISVKGLTPEQFRGWKAQWEAGENPGKVRFLGGDGVTYQPIGMSNKNMMYDKVRDYAQQDICRAFGLPWVLVNPTDATYANMGEARSAWIQHEIGSDWAEVADEMTSQLGQEFGLEIGFNLDDVEELSEAEDAMVDRSIKLLDRKVIVINEVRDTLGLDAVAWGDVPAEPVGPMKVDQADPAVGGAAPAKSAIIEHKGIQDPTPVGDAPKPWHDFDRRVTAFEQRAQRKQTAFFKRQGRVITARIGAGKGKSIEKAITNWWDQERWNDELSQDLDDTYSDTIDAFGTQLLVSLGGGHFNVHAERVRRYITQRSTSVAGLVNDTTEADVRQILADDAAAGMSVDEMVADVRDYFEGDRAASRAETFARTEVIGAANFGGLEAAKQSGLVTGKTWLATDDERTDPDCSDLDGTTVALDDSFGDVDAPPYHPNCRCTLTFELADGGTANDDQTGDDE